MRKIISILGIIVLLGAGLFFLKPNSIEKRREPKSANDAEKIEDVGKVNPFVTLAMQATEPKLLDSLNKTSFDLLGKVRLAVVKITKSGNSNYSLGCIFSQNGLIVTTAKNLSPTGLMEIILPAGMPAKAKLVESDPKTGLSFLKLEGTATFSAVDLNESFQTGDLLLIVGKDASLNTNVVLRSNVSGRMQDQSIIFYLPKSVEDAFVFNAQGQLLGIGVPFKGNKDGVMTMISAGQINTALKPSTSQ